MSQDKKSTDVEREMAAVDAQRARIHAEQARIEKLNFCIFTGTRMKPIEISKEVK